MDPSLRHVEVAGVLVHPTPTEYDRRVTATSHDEVGDLARAFNAMAKELAEVDRLRRDLVAKASHELRTPITALHATLENLVDGVAVPDAEILTSMLGEVNRLERLVGQLLDLSRLEAGAAPLELTTFEIAPLLETAATRARNSDLDAQAQIRIAYAFCEQIDWFKGWAAYNLSEDRADRAGASLCEDFDAGIRYSFSRSSGILRD